MLPEQQLCIYTPKYKEGEMVVDSILIYADETNHEFRKEVYSKVYQGVKFPINQQECIVLPKGIFKQNIPYRIVLSLDPIYDKNWG